MLTPRDIFSSERIELRFEALGFASSIALLGRYNYSHAGAVHRGHCHPDIIEISYLIRGRQTYRADDQDYVLEPGDVFVTFPNELHSTGGEPEEKGIMYWIQVCMPVKPREFLLLSPKQAQPLLAGLQRIDRRVFRAPRILQQCFDNAILASLEPVSSLSRLAVSAAIIELLLVIARQAEAPSTVPLSEEIRVVLALIDGQPELWPSVPDLAEHVGLSPSWFKSKFRAQVGIPPAEYILRKKIARAKELLGAKRTNVTQVAFDLGFSSSQYFATVFKRFTGKRPRDYLS